MSQPTPPLPVIAFTVACGEAARAEAQLCEATFQRWHPDIPFVCIDNECYRLLSGGQTPAWVGEVVSMRSLAGWFLSQHAQRLIYLDADLFVLGRLDGLLDPTNSTAWTSDWSAFTMGVPEAPRLNSGVLASSDPAFWRTWTASQYGYLVPAVDQVYLDQLALRLLAMAGAVQGRLIDGQPGRPYYNVSIHQIAGEWRVENGETYKGAERVLIYHQAGLKERGIATAPLELQAHLKELTRGAEAPGLAPDFHAWWQADGGAFSSSVKEQFAGWPIATLERVVPAVYAQTPGAYRTVAPLAYDRERKLEGTGWERIWKREWQAYLYLRAREKTGL